MNDKDLDRVKSPAILIGQSGEHQLDRGWHEREVDERSGLSYRASSNDAVFMLANPEDAQFLNLIISGPVDLHDEKSMRGYVIINRRKYELPLSVNSWVLRTYPLPEQPASAYRVHLYIDKVIIPDEHLHNGDARKLGWFLNSAWLD